MTLAHVGSTLPTAAPPRSAYLHIPFCHRRCFYCDFAVVPLGDRADGEAGPGSASIAHYLKLLHREIHQAPTGPPLSTVYIGGGTPSMLSAAQLAALLAVLGQRFGLAPGAEITMEMDPASFDRHRLRANLAAGINRVSLGGQSFDDNVLAGLGRRHRRDGLLESIAWLRQAQRSGELASWSLDLIQGVPQSAGAAERRRHWQHELDQAIAQEPPHLSVYDLSIEPGTVFERLRDRDALPLPDPDTAADLMDLSHGLLRAAGYGRYEISNYALPGHASRHNRVYWSGAGWWGFGLGATAAPWGQRQARPRTREAYAAWLDRQGAASAGVEASLGAPSGEASPADHDRRDAAGSGMGQATLGMPFDERLLVGLRRREGVAIAEVAESAGLDGAAIADLRCHLADVEQAGLLRVEGPRWRLSDPEGLALSNAVLRELLAWWERRGSRSSPAAPRSPDPDRQAEAG